MRHGSAFAMSLLAVAVAVGIGLVAAPGFEVWAFALVGLSFVLVGVFLSVRASGNLIGWLLVAYGLLLETTTFLDSYVESGMPAAAWVAWVSNWVWYPQVAVLGVLIPLFFPDGELPGRRWRWVLIAAAVGWIGFGFGNAFTDVLLDSYGLANPAALDVPPLLEGSLQIMGFVGLLVAIGGGAAAAVVRFRASTGPVRQQMKWFVSAAGLLAFSFVVNGVLYETGSPELGQLLLVVASLGLAGAIGIAVMKYRLYDIDKIVSRTLAYALLVAVLGAIFALGVVAIPNLVIGESAPPLLVAATTLLVAALFNPVRGRVQGSVDRRFNRSRYDSDRVVHEFIWSMQDATDPDAVVDGWVDVVSETMHPSRVGLWLRI